MNRHNKQHIINLASSARLIVPDGAECGTCKFSLQNYKHYSVMHKFHCLVFKLECRDGKKTSMCIDLQNLDIVKGNINVLKVEI